MDEIEDKYPSWENTKDLLYEKDKDFLVREVLFQNDRATRYKLLYNECRGERGQNEVD